MLVELPLNSLGYVVDVIRCDELAPGDRICEIDDTEAESLFQIMKAYEAACRRVDKLKTYSPSREELFTESGERKPFTLPQEFNYARH